MSEYSTPKVTIDLAEYTELLEKVNKVPDNLDNEALTMIIALLNRDRQLLTHVLEDLTRKRIRLSIINNFTTEIPTVKVEKI